MKRIARRAGMLCLLLLGVAPLAHAQMFRAYLASYGVDTNPCTVAQPCRLLPAALNAVATGGEIWMLDSANFNAGTVNVTKAVTILAIPGQVGSIVAVNAAPAMVISASAISVVLRNVSVVTNAVNPGTDGIQVQGGNVSIENSVFQVKNPSVSTNALWIDGSTSVVSVSHSFFHQSDNAIWVQGGARLSVSTTKFANVTYSVFVTGNVGGVTTYATVDDCEISWAYSGPYAGATSSTGVARVVMNRTSVTDSGYGVAAVAGTGTAYLTVGQSNLSNNFYYGMYQYSGGVLETLGNNIVRGNAYGVSIGSITPVSTQ